MGAMVNIHLDYWRTGSDCDKMVTFNLTCILNGPILSILLFIFTMSFKSLQPLELILLFNDKVGMLFQVARPKYDLYLVVEREKMMIYKTVLIYIVYRVT